MSDSSGDELANYDPTTPARPAKKAMDRPPRANGRSGAGPSTRSSASTSRKAGNKKGNQEEIIDLESEVEAEGELEDLDIVVIPAPPPKKGAANGRGKPSVNKGKARAEPLPSKSDRSVIEQPMEVDDVQADDHPVIPARRPTRTRPETSGAKTDASLARQNREHESLSRELESLRRQLDHVTSERDKYSGQLEELFQIRRTEPEQALEEQSAQYEARLKTQESMINELTSQLTKIKALGGSEKSYMLHFLTREAADEEKEAIKQEIWRWKDTVKQKDAQLAEKDRRIAELENQEKILRSDLAAEIERGRTLSQRNPPPSVTRNMHVKPAEDPKNALVIRLYEDMTNFLVVSAKIEKSPFFNLDEPVFTCIYTFKEGTADDGGASLNFTLRETWDKPDDWDPKKAIMSKDELVHKVQYRPRELQNELPEFVEALEFFRDPFIFVREQLPVFLKTLSDKISSASSQSGEEAEEDQLDDEVEIVNP